MTHESVTFLPMFPNIHYKKSVSSQVSMDKFFNSLKHMIVVTKHTLIRHNYMEKHSPTIKTTLAKPHSPYRKLPRK